MAMLQRSGRMAMSRAAFIALSTRGVETLLAGLRQDSGAKQ
jgi:hypothetical protein